MTAVLSLVAPLDSSPAGPHPALAAYADAVLATVHADAAGAALEDRLRAARQAGAHPDLIADLRDRALIHLTDVEEPTQDREAAAHAAAWAISPDATSDISGELLAAPRWFPR